jgi:hypothetical protein
MAYHFFLFASFRFAAPYAWRAVYLYGRIKGRPVKRNSGILMKITVKISVPPNYSKY